MSVVSGMDVSSLIKKTNALQSIDVTKLIKKACLIVEEDAKRKVPKVTCELRDSIKTKVLSKGNKIIGEVGTPLEYAPYVEFGTGLFSSMGTGREGYWVFVKHTDGSKTSKLKKTYTLEEAKKVMAILRSKGLEAFYTNGRHPQPYLQPALDNNKSKIESMLKEELQGEIKNNV